MQISGSTILLTGATGGLGQAIARALHARGGKLVLTGRRTDVLDPLADELKGSRTLAVDLSRPDEIDRLLAKAGDVDILVANAALPAAGTLDSFTMEQIDRALNVNLRGQGHLLFMSSLAGKSATPGTGIYNATKFGLRGFASALRADLHGSGVGVSAVFPGFIRDAGMFAEAEVKLPTGVGTSSPEDVARAVLSAIERNRAEVDVAPLTMRAGATFAGIAPELASRVARRFGSEGIAKDMEHGQRGKR
jgi:uncharacterized protein